MEGPAPSRRAGHRRRPPLRQGTVSCTFSVADECGPRMHVNKADNTAFCIRGPDYPYSLKTSFVLVPPRWISWMCILPSPLENRTVVEPYLLSALSTFTGASQRTLPLDRTAF